MSWGSDYDKKVEEYETLVAAGYAPVIMGPSQIGACHLKDHGGHLVGASVTEEWCKKHGGTWTSSSTVRTGPGGGGRVGFGGFPLLFFPTHRPPIPVPPAVPTPPPAPAPSPNPAPSNTPGGGGPANGAGTPAGSGASPTMGLKAKDPYGNYTVPAAADPGTTDPEFTPPKGVPTKGIKAKVIKGKT